MRRLATLFAMLGLTAGGIAGVALSTIFAGRWLGPVGMFVPVLAFIGWVAWRLAAAIGNARLYSQGVALAQQGRFSQAIELDKTRGRGRTAALWYGLGLSCLQLWRLEEADEALRRMRSRGPRLVDLNAFSPALLAIVAGLRGRIDEVWQWLEEAKRLGRDGTAYVTLANAVIAARAGEWAEVRQLLQRFEVKLLGGPLRGLADALHAWSVEALTGELRYVDRVAIFGEGSDATLKKYWPELVAFIERAPSA